MKKRIAFLTAVLICLTVLSGCCLEHQWQDATCEAPKTCAECGETEGEALGHDWVSATCQEPAYCSICNETTGDVAPHTWVRGYCETTCKICGTLQPGCVPTHVWQPATCIDPATCKWCRKTKGEADGDHDWEPATIDDPMTCKICGITEGEPLQLDPRFNREVCKSISDATWGADIMLPTSIFTFWNRMDQLNCTLIFSFLPDGTLICQLETPGSGPPLTITAEGVYYIEDGYLYIGRDWDQPMDKLEITIIATDESARCDAFILRGSIEEFFKGAFIKAGAVIDVFGVEFREVFYDYAGNRIH